MAHLVQQPGESGARQPQEALQSVDASNLALNRDGADPDALAFDVFMQGLAGQLRLVADVCGGAPRQGE
jgi:hypothetical protein